MQADARRSAGAALVTNFAGQWLYLRNLRTVGAERRTCFPSSTTTCARRFSRRPSCSSQDQLQADRSVVDLLTANYTFLNERLARHYGIPNVYGSHFRRVSYPDDRRAGLLGQGSILTVTSYPEPHLAGEARQVAARESARRAAAAAAAERAGAAGERRGRGADDGARADWSSTGRIRCARAATRRWIRSGSRSRISTRSASGAARMQEAKTPIDASGTLPDGTKFSGPVGVPQGAARPARSTSRPIVTEKLLTYGLGRGLESYDMPVVRQIIMRRCRPDRLSLVGAHSRESSRARHFRCA